jgi:23S rRNA pseudouridine1911/1915/1917 synthase
MIDANMQDDELYEHFSFTADEGQTALRVDKFLMNRIENATRNKIQQAAKAGSVHVNGSIVKSNYKVKGGDTVQVLFAHPPHENLLVGENIPLNIVYEDDALLVVDKPAGLVVHPGHGNYSGTLLNALIYHIENLPTNRNDRPGLVHRIDKDTSGLLVVAKTEHAMAHLAQQFYDKTSERSYLALVWGEPTDDKGTVEGHLGRDPKNRLLMTVFPDADQGKEAVTHY